jgi:transcriptional regulator with XRE-family HTH domain
MTNNQAFGVVLREIRTEKKIAQDTLAFDANLDRTYISTLELGRRSPSLNTMMALCEALHVPLSEMILRMEAILAVNE